MVLKCGQLLCLDLGIYILLLELLELLLCCDLDN
jgi:hypothetical protein